LGFEKKEKFLIAFPEKALFDYLYFVFKGLRIFRKDDFELKKIKKERFWEFVKKAGNEKLEKFIKELNL
jgi:predicted peroxiredoxin